MRVLKSPCAQALPAILVLACCAAGAQAQGRAASIADFKALPGHVPAWANEINYVAPVSPDQAMGPMTLVLARRPDREQALEKLLADQQDPASPMYHHWLTSDEIGERYGLTAEELAAVRDWLESEGLHVTWVAAGRNFIAFTGSAADVSRALQTDLNYYDVDGDRKISNAGDPMLPAEVAPLVKAIQGLYSVKETPQHRVRVEHRVSPDTTLGSTSYVTVPADFAKIYDVPGGLNGQGVTIGIVGRSRTDFADYENFRSATATSFANPTEVVPTAFGGVDPGPAYTTQQPSGADIGDQLEATLDVFRAASIAEQAKVLLVVATAASGGIQDDAQYLIQSNPVPAQIMNISFGACETNAGPANVELWEGMFQQAVGEGISVFVSSGDSGASICDAPFNPPPASPLPNSINFICSSGYVTCVGGTEFNDANDYAKYWSPSNGAGLESALSYIPEGAWNEQPENSANEYLVAASGGGVSTVISTPSWQKATGVPSARAGRYTPDLAFLSSEHDGYFGCSAAGGGSCVSGSNGIPFEIFFGTSAAAPDMAGITALLDQQLGGAQGNLNPRLYAMAASVPKAFHDVTVASSGVSKCTLSTPSMCNNSVPGQTSLTGGQAGYEVGAGYDEVTGLGSLDVNVFIENYGPGTVLPPAITTGAATSITGTGAMLGGTVNPNGQKTQYWFLYGTSSTLAGAAKSAVQTASGSSAIAVTAQVAGLAPTARYYFELQASNAGGTSKGQIASFVTPKASQTIDFKQPPSSVVYGVKPIKLSAKASSGLAVTLTVIRGHATLSGTTLTVLDIGTIKVRATQAGDKSYSAATEIIWPIKVTPAQLTVTAENLSMTQGGKVPTLAAVITGFVNNDTVKVVHGAPSLSTTAKSSSPPGNYPIDVGLGNLGATNYTFKPKNGTLTVNP